MSDDQSGTTRAQRADRNRRPRRGGLVAAIMVIAVLGLELFTAGPAAATAAPGPCDIYAMGGTPCVAAYSTTRAMYADYHGALYAVRRASDDATLGIGTLETGYVDAAAQDRFCAHTRCQIIGLVDQSPNRNDLTIEGPGANGGQDIGVNAGALAITIAGHQAYGMDFGPRMGYRDDTTHGVATGAEPESMYMVTAGTHTNSSCCFDFGNAETNNADNGNGHMDAIYFGSDCWLEPPRCPPGGPWVQADLENGIIASSRGVNEDPAYHGSTSPFVTAMLENNGTNAFVLGTANAQAGPLTPVWDGALPSNAFDPDPPSFVVPYPDNPGRTEVTNPLLSGYSPMHKEGAIVLGTGGDNTAAGVGSFFEGAITAGVPSLVIEGAIQANVVAAGYATTHSAAVPDVPELAVRTHDRLAVAEVLCPVICEARMTMSVQSRPRSAPVQITGPPHALAGAALVRLALPRRVVVQARRLGLSRLAVTVTVRAAASQPRTPRVSRTVHLAFRL